MLLSEQLSNLSLKAKNIEDKATSFNKSAQDKKEAILKDVKQNAIDAKVELDGKVDNLKEKNKNFWVKVREKHNEFIGREKQRVSDIHQTIKKTDAEFTATLAEEDAEASILFAIHSLAIAEEAVLGALDARAYADSL